MILNVVAKSSFTVTKFIIQLKLLAKIITGFRLLRIMQSAWVSKRVNIIN